MSNEDARDLPIHGIGDDGGPQDDIARGGDASTFDAFEGFADYFGYDETEKFTLPDGKQWIGFRRLTEGDRAKFERSTQRDVKFNRKTDDAAIRLDSATDRHELIKISVTDWYMVRRNRADTGWEVQAFSKAGHNEARGPGSFEQWLNLANPKIVNDLYLAIRKANPFLAEDLTLEMIDEELDRLKEMREEKVKELARGKAS